MTSVGIGGEWGKKVKKSVMKCDLSCVKLGICLQIFGNFSAVQKVRCLLVRKTGWSIRWGKYVEGAFGEHHMKREKCRKIRFSLVLKQLARQPNTPL
jgi:hypothetical protein